MKGISFSHKERYILLIDFGNSDYVHSKNGSRSVSANAKKRKCEHRKLCRVFGLPIPEKYIE